MENVKILRNHRFLAWFSCLCLLAITGLANPLCAGAGQFSADLTLSKPSKTIQGKLYVQNANYRMELHDGDKTTIVLVDEQAGLTRALKPSQKVYLEMENTDLGSVMNNPFVSLQISQSQYETRNMGKETVNGYPCARWLTRSYGKDFLTAWVSDTLGFPVKIVNHLRKGEFTELTNIKEGPQKAHLFRLPAGYAKMESPKTTAEKASPAGTAKRKAGSMASGKTASTEASPAIMFILDASGSMWGQIDGKAKIEIARDVMTGLIRNLPDTTTAGLAAYGHRRKGDCQDVEELVPLQPIDKKRLIEKIKAISPKGKTPITLSIRKTAEKLKSVEEETTIILVSDGKETCEGDPCALVKELKAAGIRFTMYVIGFDVGEAENAQLECIAKAGGGQYFTAKTAREFQVAAKAVVKESQNFGYLNIRALRNGKAISARVDVFPQGEKKTVKSIRSVTEPGQPGSKLKPGVYDLTITDIEVRPPQKVMLSGVAVTAGGSTEKSVDFSGGRLSVAVLANGKKETAGLYVYPAGKNQTLATGDTSRDNPRTFVLGPGVYDLRVLYKKAKPEIERRFNGIEVKAGQAIEKRVEFGEGKLSVEVLVNGKKGPAGFSIYEAGTKNRVATGDTSRDNPKISTLNPGTYDLQVVYKGSRPETKRRFNGIEIKAGQTEKRKAEFGEGKLSVEVLVNGKKGPAGFSIYEAGTKNRVATGDTSRDNPKVRHLNPGTYDLQVMYIGSKPETKRLFNGIEIKPGQTEERKAEFAEGKLSVEVLVNGNKGSAGFYIFAAGTKNRIATGDTSRDNPKVRHLNPGNYDVKVFYRNAIPEKEIVLENIQVVQAQTSEQRVEYQEGILNVKVTSGGQPTRGGLSFFLPGNPRRIGTGDAKKPVKLQPGQYEVAVKAYKLEGQPVKRIPFTIQAGQTTDLDVDF